MKKFGISILGVLILLPILNTVEAQTGFTAVPSRYYEFAPECASCVPAMDGVIRWRIKPDSVVVGGTSDAPTLAFTFQARLIQTNATVSSLLNIGPGIRITLSHDGFGDINNPKLTSRGGRVIAFNADTSKCELERGIGFAPSGPADQTIYNITLVNDIIGIDGEYALQEVYVNAGDTSFNDPPAAPLDKTWRDFMSLECKITDTDQEANLGLTAAAITLATIRTSTESDAVERAIGPVVDNQFRGFRLDGKTYAKRYSRFSSGEGLRVEFSKGIKTQLTSQSFTIYDANETTLADDGTTTITKVTHTPNSAYAYLEIEGEVADALDIRLTTASSILDVEDTELATANYVATINFENRSPRATAMTKDSTFTPPANTNQARFEILFTKALNSVTVSEDAFCITTGLDNEFCPATNPDTGIRIVSAGLKSGTTDTVQLVVDQGSGQQGGTYSIEVRRNELLGADFAVAEDYQDELRDKLVIADTIPPTLTLEAITPTGTGGVSGIALETNRDATNITHNLAFRLTTNEPLKAADSEDSYVLLRVKTDNSVVVASGAPAPSVVPSEDGLSVTIRYTSVALPVASEAETKGYTVGRKTSTPSSVDALDDLSGKEPTRDGTAVIANNQPIGVVTDDSSISLTARPLVCAAYANNATTLFVKVDIDGTVDPAKFFLGSGAGTAIPAASVAQIDASLPSGAKQVGMGAIYKITVAAQTGAMQTIQYKDSTASPAISESAECEQDSDTSDATPDADLDRTTDATDSNPFVDHPPVLIVTRATATLAARSKTELSYVLNFTLTASEPVPNLDIPGYVFLPITLAGTERSSATGLRASGAATVTGNDSEVSISQTIHVTRVVARTLRGFVLGMAANMVDRSGNRIVNSNGVRVLIFGPIAPLTDANALAVIAEPLACAFYEGTRQELYVQIDASVAGITPFSAINTAGFTLSGSDGLTIGTVTPLGAVANNYGAARLSLNKSPGGSAVTVTYKHDSSASSISGMCQATTASVDHPSLQDWDSDRVRDDLDIPVRLAYNGEEVLTVNPFVGSPPIIQVAAVASGDGRPGVAYEVERSETAITYNLAFEVRANEQVNGLSSSANYVLLRVPADYDYTDTTRGTVVTNSSPSSVTLVDGKANTVLVTYTGVELAVADEEGTLGYTLGQTTHTFNASIFEDEDDNPATYDGTNEIPGPGVPITPVSEDLVSAVATLKTPLTCAAIYPNIGQNELFLQLEEIGLDEDGFSISYGSEVMSKAPTIVSVDTVEEKSADDIIIVKIRLSSVTTNTAEIVVNYQPPGQGADPEETSCDVSLADDTDDDGVIDVADANPFTAGDDSKAATYNPTVARLGGLAAAPQADNYISRTLVIPGLLRGDFSYIQIDEDMQDRVERLENGFSAQQYFGVVANAELYIDKTGSMCADRIGIIKANHLIKANISDVCEVITDEVLEQEYSQAIEGYWLLANNDVAMSEDQRVTFMILPEVNFDGQSSYLLGDTTPTLKITSYDKNASDTDGDVGYLISYRFGTSATVEVDVAAGTAFNRPSVNADFRTATVPPTIVTPRGVGYPITDRRYWLSRSNTIWAPRGNEPIELKEGGLIAGNYTHTIGPSNSIYIAVREEEAPVPFELENVSLIPIRATTPTPVQAVLAGEEYRFTVHYKELLEILKPIFPTGLVGLENGYNLDSDSIKYSTTETTFNFTVDAEVSTDIKFIEVGVEINGTEITRSYPLTGSEEFANLSGTVATDKVKEIIQTKIAGQRVVPSPAALLVASQKITDAIAAGETVDAAFVNGAVTANFDPADLLKVTEGTNGPLDFETIMTEDGTTITNAYTFEIRNVALAADEEDIEQPTGGMSQITIYYDVTGNPGEVNYVGKYNSISGRWERFERGIHRDVIDREVSQRDTWYAIDSDDYDGDGASNDEAEDCAAADISTYQAEHKAAGENDTGFDIENASCILVVISDGGPYDFDGQVDGTIIDPIAIAGSEFAGTAGADSSGRGGGGGAIGGYDIALLALALLVLLVMHRRRLL